MLIANSMIKPQADGQAWIIVRQWCKHYAAATVLNDPKRNWYGEASECSNNYCEFDRALCALMESVGYHVERWPQQFAQVSEDAKEVFKTAMVHFGNGE